MLSLIGRFFGDGLKVVVDHAFESNGHFATSGIGLVSIFIGPIGELLRTQFVGSGERFFRITHVLDGLVESLPHIDSLLVALDLLESLEGPLQVRRGEVVAIERQQ